MKYLFLLLFLVPNIAYCDDSEAILRGKKLVQDRLYDEALPILAPLEASKQDNPVDLLFYRACCNFYLLNKEEAIKDLKELEWMQNDLPERYKWVAARMYQEIKPLEEDS